MSKRGESQERTFRSLFVREYSRSRDASHAPTPKLRLALCFSDFSTLRKWYKHTSKVCRARRDDNRLPRQLTRTPHAGSEGHKKQRFRTTTRPQAPNQHSREGASHACAPDCKTVSSFRKSPPLTPPLYRFCAPSQAAKAAAELDDDKTEDVKEGGVDAEVAIPGVEAEEVEEEEEEEESSAAGFFSKDEEFATEPGFVDEVRAPAYQYWHVLRCLSFMWIAGCGLLL